MRRQLAVKGRRETAGGGGGGERRRDAAQRRRQDLERALRSAIEAEFGGERILRRLRLAYADAGLRSRLMALGAVRGETDVEGQGWDVEVDMPRRLVQQLASLPGAQGELVRAQLLPQVEAD